VAQVAVCSQIKTKHTNTVWAERTVVEMLNWWCITYPVGFKRLNAKNTLWPEHFLLTWTFKFPKCSDSEKQLHKIHLIQAPNRIEIFKNCSLFVENSAIILSISLFIRLHLLAFTSPLPF